MPQSPSELPVSFLRKDGESRSLYGRLRITLGSEGGVDSHYASESEPTVPFGVFGMYFFPVLISLPIV